MPPGQPAGDTRYERTGHTVLSAQSSSPAVPPLHFGSNTTNVVLAKDAPIAGLHDTVQRKKGISSNQLHRTLGITLKSAWFVGHRIREAMRTGSLMAPMGGDNGEGSGIVEADETYHGKIVEPAETRTSGQPFKTKRGKGPANKRAIVSRIKRLK